MPQFPDDEVIIATGSRADLVSRLRQYGTLSDTMAGTIEQFRSARDQLQAARGQLQADKDALAEAKLAVEQARDQAIAQRDAYKAALESVPQTVPDLSVYTAEQRQALLTRLLAEALARDPQLAARAGVSWQPVRDVRASGK